MTEMSYFTKPYLSVIIHFTALPCLQSSQKFLSHSEMNTKIVWNKSDLSAQYSRSAPYLLIECLAASILCCWYHTCVLFPDLRPHKSFTSPSQSLRVFTLPLCPSAVAASSTARWWCSRLLWTCKRNHHKVSSEREFVATVPSASPLLGLVNVLRREMCLSLT